MDDRSNANYRIAHNTLFLYMRMAIVMFVSLYTARVVLNVLGVDDYGIYNVVCGFVSLFSVLNVTLTNGTQRYYNQEIGKGDAHGVTRVFNASLRIHTLIAIGLFIIVEMVGLWYIDSKMIIDVSRRHAALWVFQFSLFSLVLMVIQAPFSSAIISFERMDFYAIMSIFDVMIKLAIAFLIQTICFDKLIVYGMLMAVASLISFLLCFFYCKTHFKEIHFSKDVDSSLLGKLTTFSGWLILDPFAYTMRGQGCNMILNLFFGTIVNAAYGIANQVGASLDSFCSNIGTAFKPQLMQSFSAGDYGRTVRLLYIMSKIMFLLKLMLCVPIILEIQTLLRLWLGDGFPTYAMSFASLSVIVRLVDSLNMPISTIILAIGNIKRYMIWTSLVVFSTLPVSYVLFWAGCDPQYTFYAMIGLTLLNQFISVNILGRSCIFFNRVDYGRRVIIPCLAQFVIVFTISAVVSFYLEDSISRLICVCISSFISSVFSAYFVALESEERKFLTNTITKVFRSLLIKR